MDRADLLRAIAVFSESRSLDLQGLQAALERAGFSSSSASDLIEFVPLAFGRLLLHGAQLSDEFVRIDGDGRERVRGSLQAHPVFRAALDLAPDVAKGGSDAFMSVAGRSSELQAANKALQAGSALENLRFSPPMLLWGEAEPGAKPRWWQPWKRSGA